MAFAAVLRTVFSLIAAVGTYEMCDLDDTCHGWMQTDFPDLVSSLGWTGYPVKFRHDRRLLSSPTASKKQRTEATVRRLQGLDSLPLKEGGLMALLTGCDIMSLLNYVSVFTDEDVDIVETFLQNTEVVAALCKKPQCPATIAEVLDISKLPAEVGEVLGKPGVEEALATVLNQVCLKNDAGDYCVLEATNDVLAREENPGRRPDVCDSGCLDALGETFIDEVKPVLASLAPAGSDIAAFDPDVLCAPPSAALGASATKVPSVSKLWIVVMPVPYCGSTMFSRVTVAPSPRLLSTRS